MYVLHISLIKILHFTLPMDLNVVLACMISALLWEVPGFKSFEELRKITFPCIYDLRNSPWLDTTIDINSDLQRKNIKLYVSWEISESFPFFIPGEDSWKVSLPLDWLNAIFTDGFSVVWFCVLFFLSVWLLLFWFFFLMKTLGSLSKNKGLTNHFSVYN